MKKITFSVLCLIFLLCASIGLIGCGKENHTHAFTEQNVKQTYLAEEATCTAAAKYYYSCSCGEKGTEIFEIGNGLGHDFGDWVTVKEPSETEKGLRSRTCSRNGCSYSETEEIPEPAHRHYFTTQNVNEKYLSAAATCTEPARYYYSCFCGEKGTETFDYGNATGHSFTEQKIDDKYLVSVATCTEKAVYYYSCRCGEKPDRYSYWLTFEYGNPKGHAEVIDEAIAPTRTENGLTEGKHCSICGAVLVEQQIVYAIGSLGLTYDGNTVTGIGTCTDSDILIPACSPEGNLVTAIGDMAFANSKATSITIPDTVTRIGKRAFYNCAEITEMHIPSSVINIDTQIFYKTNKLSIVYYDSPYTGYNNPFLKIANIKKIVFGGNFIPERILSDCTNITEVEILNSVTYIGDYSFYGCSNLTKICITDLTAWCEIYRLENLMQYSYNTKLYINNKLVTDLVIPDSITSINDYAINSERDFRKTQQKIPNKIENSLQMIA